MRIGNMQVPFNWDFCFPYWRNGTAILDSRRNGKVIANKVELEVLACKEYWESVRRILSDYHDEKSEDEIKEINKLDANLSDVNVSRNRQLMETLLKYQHGDIFISIDSEECIAASLRVYNDPNVSAVLEYIKYFFASKGFSMYLRREHHEVYPIRCCLTYRDKYRTIWDIFSPIPYKREVIKFARKYGIEIKLCWKSLWDYLDYE